MNRAPLAGPVAVRLALRLVGASASRLLSSTAKAALVAVGLGVAALGIAMALMTGYREDLAERLVGGGAPVLIYANETRDGTPSETSGDRVAEPVDVATVVRAVAGVTEASRVGFREAVVAAGEREAEVTVRGSEAGAGPFAIEPGALEPSGDGAWRAVLGAKLADALGVAAGDRIRLTLLSVSGDAPRFAFRTLEVSGTFASGFSDFDRSWLVVDRRMLAGTPGGSESVWEVRVAELARAAAIADEIRGRLGEGFVVLDWRQLYRSLFSALDLLQRTLFVLLALIVLVATFNVASTVVVLVRERRRDFGVLAAVGLPPRSLRAAFLLVAALLGVLGAAGGLALAAAVSWVTTRFELLSFGPGMEEVYFVRSIPLRLEPGAALAIGALAIAVTLLAAWLPARRAARLEPADALRFE